MADPKLTQEQKQKIADWLNSRSPSGTPVCPFCASREWIIADHLVQAAVVGPSGDLQIGGIGYPQVMLISTGCGHTVFFNAVLMGIMGDTPKEGGGHDK